MTVVCHSSHVNSGNSHNKNSPVFICATSRLELCAHRDGKCFMQTGKERMVDKGSAHLCCAHGHISARH